MYPGLALFAPARTGHWCVDGTRLSLVSVRNSATDRPSEYAFQNEYAVAVNHFGSEIPDVRARSRPRFSIQPAKIIRLGQSRRFNGFLAEPITFAVAHSVNFDVRVLRRMPMQPSRRTSGLGRAIAVQDRDCSDHVHRRAWPLDRGSRVRADYRAIDRAAGRLTYDAAVADQTTSAANGPVAARLLTRAGLAAPGVSFVALLRPLSIPFP